MGMGGQRHRQAALPPGKTRYPLYRRMDGPQDRSGRVQKISPLATSASRYGLDGPGVVHVISSNLYISVRHSKFIKFDIFRH